VFLQVDTCRKQRLHSLKSNPQGNVRLRGLPLENINGPIDSHFKQLPEIASTIKLLCFA